MPDARPVVRPYTPTALPSVTARALAFVAIIVGGVCGGLIAYAIADLQCGSSDGRAEAVGSAPQPGPPAPPPSGAVPPAPGDAEPADGGCTTISGLAGLVGATSSAVAVSVIAVLVLRAMAEWRRDPAPEG